MAKEPAGSQVFVTVTKGSITEFYKSCKHLVNFCGFLHVFMRVTVAMGFKANRSHAKTLWRATLWSPAIT